MSITVLSLSKTCQKWFNFVNIYIYKEYAASAEKVNVTLTYTQSLFTNEIWYGMWHNWLSNVKTSPNVWLDSQKYGLTENYTKNLISIISVILLIFMIFVRTFQGKFYLSKVVFNEFNLNSLRFKWQIIMCVFVYNGEALPRLRYSHEASVGFVLQTSSIVYNSK